VSLPLRFGATLFVSAALLFLVEPMVGKMLMPLLGGAPAVWITCMMFFQAALLAGYAFAHATLARLGVRRQASVQLVLVALALLTLPVGIRDSSVRFLEETRAPVFALFVVLASTVGPPFFVLSTMAPVLQRWFSELGQGGSKDPYFLYGASNLGSMLALAAYPALIEPWLGLAAQASAWRWGYVGLAALVVWCSVALARRGSDESTPHPAAEAESVQAIGVGRRVRWVGLSFVPSSLLLGLTTYITTDIAAIPLFWVIPLAVYLLSFVLVFSRRPPIPHELSVRALPLVASATALMIIVDATNPMFIIVSLHLATLFLASMVCHGELARDRPPTAHLTEFYLLISLGGVLGGVFNGIVAPALFRHVVEYPLAIVLACLCRRAVPSRAALNESRARRLDLAFPAVLGALTAGLGLAGEAMKLDPEGHAFAALFAIPVFLNYGSLVRPPRFALGLAACLLGSSVFTGVLGRTIGIERNFFGVVRVTVDRSHRFNQIAVGNTLHGSQDHDPARRRTPLTYYTRSGPLGQVFDGLQSKRGSASSPGERTTEVAVIGLGAGSMAPYREPDEHWTYYEINPAVVSIAEDPRYFTFLADAFPDPSGLEIVLGDARLRLREAADASYDLVILDAFSSDAIPAHLLTREAIALYRAKMRPGGMLAAHISNRYLDLAPVFGALASDAGLFMRGRADMKVSEAEQRDGKMPSLWVVLGENDAAFGSLASDPRWVVVKRRTPRVWTDDYSNLMSVYSWWR
jgi:hypothetical protein